MKKILLTILGLLLISNAVVYAAPATRFDVSILPIMDSTFELGTTTRKWIRGFFDDLNFYGEIKPDGATCADGEILKKTGANNWDCAADDTVGGGAVDGTGTAGMLTSWVDVDTITATGTPTAARYVATSTTASIFPYASTTALSATTLYGALVGNASTASALFANGSNCSSGSAPLGVDASGAVESCFDVWTESENTSAAYTPQSTTITVAGTASQITSSAGAQSLAANRTWTLSLPNHVIFPSSFQVASATTTNATTTNLHITGLNCTSNSNGGALTVDANGRVACSDDDSTAGSGTSAVATSTADTATQVVFFTSTNATPATIGGDAGMTYSSSLDRLTVTRASTTQLSVSDTAWFFSNNIAIDSQIRFAGGATIDEAVGGKISIGNVPGNANFAVLDTDSLTASSQFAFPDLAGESDIFALLGANQTLTGGKIFTASSTFLSLNAVNSTTTNATTTTLAITGLATPAGAFLAVNPQGTVIATTTPTGGSGTVTNIATTYPIQGGPITTTGTLSLAFGTTTSNTWGAHNIFSSLFATIASTTNATSTNLAVTGNLDAVIPSQIDFTIGGGGSTITTGRKLDKYMSVGGTLTGHALLCDQTGSITLDVWKDVYANYPPTVADTITASDKPTVTTASSTLDADISTWTTSVTAGDTITVNVDSASTVTRCTFSLFFNKQI